MVWDREREGLARWVAYVSVKHRLTCAHPKNTQLGMSVEARVKLSIE